MFQLFWEVEDIEFLKVNGDIIPENSSCISYCLFSRIGSHFWYIYRSWKGELPLYLASSVIAQDEPNPSHPSGQDGDILAVREYPLCPARKQWVFFPFNKSFNAQACQGGWVLASFFFFFFCVVMDLVKTRKKVNPYPFADCAFL